MESSFNQEIWLHAVLNLHDFDETLIYTLQADSQSGNSRSLSKLNEVQGDLFSCPVSDSLAHCISADARMGKGIAVLFKNKFGGVEEIKSQGIFFKYAVWSLKESSIKKRLIEPSVK